MKALALMAPLVLAIFGWVTPADGATPEDVQKAYENCLAYAPQFSRQPTPEAANQEAEKSCQQARQSSCKRLDRVFCDQNVELYLVKVKNYKGDYAKHLPH